MYLCIAAAFAMMALASATARAQITIEATAKSIPVVGQDDPNIEVTGKFDGLEPADVAKITVSIQEVDAQGRNVGQPIEDVLNGPLITKDFVRSKTVARGKKYKVTTRIWKGQPPAPVKATTSEVQS